MRRKILECLFLHLSEKYDLDFSEHDYTEITLHQLEGLLAFKSDLRIEELRSALDRLEEGSYGNCILCKKSISHDALENDPAVRYCERCERAYMSVNPTAYVTVHQL